MNPADIIKGLDTTEKQELYVPLQREPGIVPQLDDVKAKLNQDKQLSCPLCHSGRIHWHSGYKGRKRHKCQGCSKTFNDFTGTAMSCLKKVDKFQEYLELAVESLTIRKASRVLGVNMKTVFEWRYKLLASLERSKGAPFPGIVECDDKQLDPNEKGSRHLCREPYKRSSDRVKKRGVSNDKVSVSDREGNPPMRFAKMGKIDEDSLHRTLGPLINKENVLCSDAHPSIIAWAKTEGLVHHNFVATRQHVKSMCFHVQHVDSLANRYERWIKRFYGVSTKYLPQYQNWFISLEKINGYSGPC